MAFVAWNARGLGSSNNTHSLRDTLIKFKPCIVFLSETKKKKKDLERLRTKNRFSGSFYVDPQGLACLVVDNGLDKRQFWTNLHLIRKNTTNKWCVIGDANIVADQSEKEGGNPVLSSQAKSFVDFMDTSGMIELPIKGGMFTWRNMRSNNNEIVERLDKILISNEWSLAFPKAIGIIEAAVASNHNPIIIMLEGLKKRGKKDFKFESRWLLEDECFSNVKEAWSENPRGNYQSNLNRKLKNSRVKLSKWSGMTYGKNRKTIEGIKSQLLDLQKLHLSSKIKEEISILKSELQKLWESEERHWHQRTRVIWIKYKDRNTKKLYTKEEAIDLNSLSDIVPNSITAEISSFLCKEVLEEEIKKVAFEMGALKSPGPDGFLGVFYQTFWETISKEVVNLVSDFFRTWEFDESINNTNIVLIPKTKNPSDVNQFRPISLCNFSLKIITKILEFKLKIYLLEIIPAYQSAFVNGRLIHDNIILAHEAFHAMKKKSKGLGYEPESRGFSGFGKWWKKLSSLNNEGNFADGLNLISFLCWNLWKSRNSLVFTASLDSPIEVWNRVAKAFEEFVSVQNNNLPNSAASSPLAQPHVIRAPGRLLHRVS
ncbi:hypothetical protein GQ457_10G006820 [Hibiscus cannabinus]